MMCKLIRYKSQFFASITCDNEEKSKRIPPHLTAEKDLSSVYCGMKKTSSSWNYRLIVLLDAYIERNTTNTIRIIGLKIFAPNTIDIHIIGFINWSVFQIRVTI